MNPLTRLKPALYAALTSPALVYQGAMVPVRRFWASNTPGNYVLLTQPTVVALSGARGCRQWTCTHLLDVVTQFQGAAVSDLAADGIAELVLQRVAGVPLAMPSQWQASPGELTLESELREEDGTLQIVRRLLRMRWTMTYSGPIDVPAYPGTLTPSEPTVQVTGPISSGTVLSLTQSSGVVAYDATLPPDMQTLYGIATSSSAGQSTIQAQLTSGIINIPGWGLVPGRTYFAGPAGKMVLSDAGLYFSQILGHSISADSFLYQPEDIVVLLNP